MRRRANPAASTSRTPSPMRQWPSRIATGLLGGAIATLAIAVLDSRLALSRSADRTRGPAFLALTLGDLGVIAPAALATAFAFSLFAILTHPSHAPCWSRLRSWLRPKTNEDQSSRALLVPLTILGSCVWLVSVANISRLVMSHAQSARLSGAATSAAALICAGLIGSLVLVASAGLTRLLGPTLLPRLRPFWPVSLSIVSFVVLLAAGVISGSTSGDGGVLGIFGVLKRPELDLTPPGLLLLVAAGAWTGASWLPKIWAPLALVVAVLPLATTARTAKALGNDLRTSAVLENNAPLGRPCLRLARRLTDHDHDGASGLFGGGDCDDRNADINPMASDVPNNGVDEDCSGADLIANTTSSSPQPAPSSQPSTDFAGKLSPDLNVMLISVDTLRWDTGYMGNPRPVTPSIDKLAAQSVVYENFYALASYTGKSIGPLMCGKYPSETSRGWSHYNSYPKTDRMVQERLKAAGVHTMSIQSHWYFKGWSGLARGFDLLDMSAAPPEGVDATEDATTSADRLTDAAVKVLGKTEHTEKRFFAWVHYFDPHAEYVRHKGTVEFGNKMRDKYDHEVRFTDDQVGRLLDFVASQPWAKHTAIVITSDHGEGFLEHGMIRHGFELWEELTRVPFLVYLPGITPKRIKTRRSAIDMVPTILDLFQVKLDTPKDRFDFISGVSLLSELWSPPDQSPAARDLLIDMPAGPNNDERRAFIQGDLKLSISNGVRYQLFNLADDPGEKNDLSEDKALLKAQRGSYDAFRVRLREVKVKRPDDE